MSPLVRNIVLTSAAFAVVGGLIWYPRDPRAAYAYCGAATFGILSVLLWVVIVKGMLGGGPIARLAAGGAFMLKFGLIAGGLYLLSAMQPLTKAMLVGVVVGVSVVMFSAVLIAAGAMMMGIDLDAGRSNRPPANDNTGETT